MNKDLIKLNLGASPIWHKDGWHTLDHKFTTSTKEVIVGDAINIDLPDESCEVVFCSHLFEHIPHYRLPIVISEINRILTPGGILRILTPNLKLLCEKYVNDDYDFFNKIKQENEGIRTDLGLGGMLTNFIVSPGQDTILMDRGLKEFIGGYAHIYAYDFDMLSKIFGTLGFIDCNNSKFCESSMIEMNEPLHIDSLPPVWQDLNQDLYNKHGFTHKLIDGKYKIDFRVTGFDRNPLISLIIETKKEIYVNKEKANRIFNLSMDNYNMYGRTLLNDIEVKEKLDDFGIKY